MCYEEGFFRRWTQARAQRHRTSAAEPPKPEPAAPPKVPEPAPQVRKPAERRREPETV